MIINNLGVLQLNKIDPSAGGSGCNTERVAHSMAFVVTSNDGMETSGKLENAQYAQFSPQGQPPYTVKVGYQNWSYQTTVQGLTSGEYAISFTTIFPSGTGYFGNGAQSFVNKLAGRGAVTGAADE
ncbi:MAG: hypothetical protein JOZ96_07695 [Acidobacteria bacterium]|nr:hypothetical protein [Acidobacteriota bacterium]